MKKKLFRNPLIHQTGILDTSEHKIVSYRALAFVLIALLAIILRLSVSFSHDLILGVDGGYYPLQVRNILNTGFLRFDDVPLYFYFCASIVKGLSLLGLHMHDESIISVIKIIDSAALPLLAIPLFKIVNRKERPIPLNAAMAMLSYALLSLTPFFILGDLQKNAFAIPLVFIFILFFEDYLIDPVRKNLAAIVITLSAIALSHFGIFAFCLTFLIISLFFIYRKNAILPSLIIFLVGFGIIALFDFNRAFRLITFWKVVFERPALLQGPLHLPLLINVIFSYFLVIFGILQFRKFKSKLGKVSEYMILPLFVMLAVFAFPVFDQQYFQRFNVLLFIPQLLLIACLIRMNQKLALPFSVSLVLLTILSFFLYFSERKKPCIDDQTFHDLQNINKYVAENKENSIIIARHGPEFWTAWVLNVNVVQDRAMDKIGLEKYSHVIFLEQKNKNGQEPFGRRLKHKPGIEKSGPESVGLHEGRPVPENFKLIYSSSSLNAYQKMN